jgi:tetratricopeptide (TPR) repeat protein
MASKGDGADNSIGDVAALVSRATVLHRAGQRADAERGYLRALDLDAGSRAALNNLGILYLEVGKHAEAAARFRRLAARFPDDPVVLSNFGRALLMAGETADALRTLERAASHRGATAETFNTLGIARARSGDREGAVASFGRALDERPDFTEALSNLVDARLEQNRFAEALAATDRVLQRFPGHAGATFKKAYALALMGEFDAARALTLDVLRVHPDHAPAHNNLGAIASWRNDLRAAIGHFEDALRRQPGFVEAEMGLAHALLARGDFERGWRHYEARPAGIGRPGDPPGSRGRIWNGEPMPRGSLLVFREGGLGDVLQFCRLVPLARARVGWLVLYLAPAYAPLARLLRSLDGVDEVVTAPDAHATCDAQVSVMSLPHLCWGDLGRTPTPVPFLTVDRDLVDAWRDKVCDRGNIKVGLAWSGDPRHGNVEANTIDRRRSMPLATLRPLFDVTGIDWYSLQKGAAASELAHAPFAARIADLTAEIGDFADTGALAMQLDLVISVDTSVLHLACALGRPTWMPNRFDSCWRWGTDRTDAPWYPTLRLFRQRTFGDWAPVVADIAGALARAAAQHESRSIAATMPPPTTT